LEGTYDLFQDNEVVGEMTVYNQSESEFAVRAKEWDAQGHISGREGYYDWRFAKGELAGQTGRTTFTVQQDGNLVGKVQGDRPELKWAYLAKPRVRPAAPLAAAGPAADEAQPSWLEGTWTGVAHQQQNNSDWSVRLVASGSSYKVSYPSLGCSGYLSVYEITSSTGRFLERITSGLDKCVDGVTITLTRVSATQIRYQAHGTDISVADLKKE